MGQDHDGNMLFSYDVASSDLERENQLLRESLNQLKLELERFRTPALMIAEVVEVSDEYHAVIRVPNGSKFFVGIAGDVKGLQPGDQVHVEQKNLTIVRRIERLKKFDVEQFVIIEKPKVPWRAIGGLNEQINLIKEVIELPLKKPELFKKVGITPPKGVLLHGPPGTGKTLLAKAVASSTKSTFIEIVGSELVQKFIGEGAKLVKEVFELARERAPSIVFIDEIDALASKRIDMGTSGEREVQRTFMQLLAEIDGFKNLDNVKIIGCTNRRDILDPAVTRPGRLDRLIEVPAPDAAGVKRIFTIHSSKMKLQGVILPELVKKMEGFSGAEIKAVVTEAGYVAIRANRVAVLHKDFLHAIQVVVRSHEEEFGFEPGIFG
ncbi:MAG: AAA family ATPase [Candidatus Woesearchaeota archaeon]|nr:MAG: AAA family ATPase [Candidatus Woesearchaeota archaeon]